MPETLSHERNQSSNRSLRRLGFGLLGVTGTLYGSELITVGTIVTPFAPVAGVLGLGLGAGLAYGGYRALKHSTEIANDIDNDPEQEARVTKRGKYLGGAALLLAGATVSGAAVGSSLGVAAAGVWVAGAAVSVWGVNKLFTSFSTEAASLQASESASPLAVRAEQAADRLNDLFDRYISQPRNVASPTQVAA